MVTTGAGVVCIQIRSSRPLTHRAARARDVALRRASPLHVFCGPSWAAGTQEDRASDVPLLGYRRLAGHPGGAGATDRRDRRAARRDHRPDARDARPRHRAARDRPGARVRSRPSTRRGSRAATSSTATSATTCCRHAAARSTSRSSTATTTGTRSYHELRMLAEAARRADAPLPDPHPARRAVAVRPPRPLLRPDEHPRGVPPAVRAAGHAARRRGSLLPHGGINPVHYNAVHRGRSAQRRDDRARRLHRRVRPARCARLVLPVYFGLAIVVEEARIDREPELGARCSTGSRAAEGKDILLEIAESTRLQAILFQHNDYYGRRDQLAPRGRPLPRPARVGAARRALPRSRAAAAVPRGLHRARQAPRPREARRPRPRDAAALGAARRASGASGASPRRRARGHEPSLHRHGTRPARPPARARSTSSATSSVGGDLVECGTGRGGGAIFMRGYLDAHDMAGKQVWVADRFRVERAPRRPRRRVGRSRTRCATASRASACSTTGSGSCRARRATRCATRRSTQIALLRIGPATAADVAAALEALYHRIVDRRRRDRRRLRRSANARQAVEEFRRATGESTRRSSASTGRRVTWRKNGPAKTPGGAAGARRTATRRERPSTPLASRARSPRRRASRTSRSSSSSTT